MVRIYTLLILAFTFVISKAQLSNVYSIHFETTDIKPIGRITSGVKGIKIDEDDEVINGLPPRDLIFLNGIPLEPPLAVIKNRVFIIILYV